MESVQCVVESSDAASSGSVSAPKSCQEYVLRGENVLFHLQPQGKGTAVLPIGQSLDYRIREGHLYLRVNGRDREFSVVAMELVESRQPPLYTAEKINHLQ